MSTFQKIVVSVMVFYLLYAAVCGTDIKILGMIVLASLLIYFKRRRF